MNTKNNVSIEKAKNNKTAAIAIVTVALTLSMMSSSKYYVNPRTTTGKCAIQYGGHSQTCTQEATAPSSSGGVDVACVQEAGQCQVAQNSGRDSPGEISGDTQDCS